VSTATEYPATSQNQSDSLETVVVVADSYRTTGTKSDLAPMQAPMSFEIYSADLLSQRQVDSVNDALRYVPGITPENRSTVTIFDQYNIRGFESIRNYYDGLVLQYNTLWNLSPQVDMYATNSVEVLKGPTSVLYGSAPPGGMINQVAKQPYDGTATNIRVRGGSLDLLELGVDHNGEIGDAINYRIIGLNRTRDGQMATTTEERTVFAPSLSIDATDKTQLHFSLYYQDDPDMIPSTPLPGEGTTLAASWGELDADAYAGDANWNSLAREVTMAGYKINHEFSSDLTFLQNFRYTDGDLLQRNTYHFAPAGQILTRSAYRTDEAIKGFTVDNQLAWTLNTGATKHKLLFGIDYQTLDSDIRYQDTFANNTPTIDLAAPNYRQMNRSDIEASFVYQQTNTIEQEQVGVYIQNEMTIGALTVLANLRHDQFESTDSADFGGFLSATEIDQSETTGRLAAIYNFDSGWKPYISYAESFEPTSGVDSITGNVFEPTTAEQAELGIKYLSDNNNTAFSVAVFDIAQQNVIVNTPDFLQRTQRGEVTSTGVEFALTQKIGDSVELVTSYGYQNVRVTENPLNNSLVDKTPVWVSDQQASIWGTYYANPELTFSLGVRYIGESELDATNSDTLPGYTLVDIAGTYSLNSSVELGLSVNNLEDKRYVGACFDGNNCWMGAQRNAEVTVNVSF
jgi:iron complex outermembrane receptor protein